jgi:hypothetical protein
MAQGWLGLSRMRRSNTGFKRTRCARRLTLSLGVARTMYEHFYRFLDGFSAAAELLQRATTKSFVIEAVLLSASVIDGALRVALVLQHQIRTASSEVPDALVYQGPADRIISERAIYKRAVDELVIGPETFRELERLYTERNRVVHRYIISEITTLEIESLVSAYRAVIQIIYRAVYVLESKPIRLGLGMTRPVEPGSAEATLDSASARKHGDQRLSTIFKKQGSGT